MDIIIFGMLLFFSLGLVSLGLRFKANYLSAVAGIVLILIGINVSIDAFLTAGLTQAFCVTDNAADIVCKNHALPLLEIGYQFWIGFGGMLMFAGLGCVVDSIIRVRGPRYQ